MASDTSGAQKQIAFWRPSGAIPEEPLWQRPERRFRPSGRIFHEKSGLAAFFRPYRVTAARASERFGCRYDPFATAVLPVFIRVRDLGLLDTYWGVILPQVAFNLGFSVVLR